MLKFRNLVVSPDEPVDAWGFEGLLTAIDRGDITHWRKIAAAVRREPWGPLADELVEALNVAEDSGVVGAIRAALASARADVERVERQVVADELRRQLARTGLTADEFARRLGTSRSRLSSYLNGRVCPAATVLVRAARVADFYVGKPNGSSSTHLDR